MDKIGLHIVTGDGPVFERQVEYVNLPTGYGSLGILPNHAAMLCAVEAGVVRCRWSEGEARVRVSAGVASVEKNEITVIVSAGEVLAE